MGAGTEQGVHKKLNETECEKRIAYEVSISRLEEVRDYVG